MALFGTALAAGKAIVQPPELIIRYVCRVHLGAMTASPLGVAPIGCCSKRRPAHLPSSSTFTGSSSILFVSPWRGLNHLCISFRGNFTHLEKKGKSNRMAVHASLFGVGAPEVLVIGVVALLVFGPKGLAEVARNLGKTLRTFQPTIRELQEVSREFKSTFEREIGLDEVSSAYRSNSRMNQSQQEVSDSKRRPTPKPEEKLTMKTEPEPEEKLTMKTEPEPEEKLTMKSEEELAATTKSQTDSSEEQP